MTNQSNLSPELGRTDTGAMGDAAHSSTLDSSGHTHNNRADTIR